MGLPSASAILEFPSAFLIFVWEKLLKLFLSPGSFFSLASLFSALCVAVLFLGLRRAPHKRDIKLPVLLRALFPRRLLRSRSSRADVGFFLFNTFLAGTLFGWAILSYRVVSKWVNEALIAVLGATSPTQLSGELTTVILTVALFLAYELGYWLDHYLSHRIPFLWEFHKVHHTAEVLSPLTNFRVHPVDSFVYYNILAVTMGLTSGLVNYGFGKSVQHFTIADSNIIVLVFGYLVTHLQHSHIWMPFTGIWGRIFLSPAHHQIHHSTNPVHFNKNLGSGLCIWDWAFGTLHVPSRKREKLIFGVDPKSDKDHTVEGELIFPVYRALAHLRSLLPQGATSTSRAREPS